MSMKIALGNALSGLNAAARMAEVVGANIANAQTDGYGRRVVDLSSQSLGGRGAGVRIEGIVRVTDRVLINDRRGAEANLAAGNQRLDAIERVEAAWTAGGEGATLGGRIAALENALIAAAAEPYSETRLATVATRLSDLTATVRAGSDALKQERERADAAIAADVGRLNAALAQVEDLNGLISRSRQSGEDANGLMDERQKVIDRIAAIVPIREVERDRGRVALFTTTGVTLLDPSAATVGFTPTPTITADMTFAGGALGGLSVNGRPVPGNGAAGRLEGGSLGANVALRDEILPERQAALDALARDLIDRFADPGTDPTLLPGDAGLLTDGGGAFDPADLAGLAGRLSVNAAVDPAQGGALFRLRDGVNAAAAGPAGRAAQLDAWVDALAERRTLAPGGASRSAAGHAAAVTAALGAVRLGIENEAGMSAARFNALRERELAMGVDTDAEMQSLLMIEQSYAANARVIETVDFMIRRLMEI